MVFGLPLFFFQHYSSTTSHPSQPRPPTRTSRYPAQPACPDQVPKHTQVTTTQTPRPNVYPTLQPTTTMSTTPQTSTKTHKTLGNLLHLKQQDRIGWIGLGQMGYYMARNLQGYLSSRSLTMNVWNRSPAKSAKMHNHGARESKTIEDLVANSNIVRNLIYLHPQQRNMEALTKMK